MRRSTRRSTVFFLSLTQSCGWERRRVCCAGMERSLLRQVCHPLFAISRYFPFFATGTRTPGLARVADSFGITPTEFLWRRLPDRSARSSKTGREIYGLVAHAALSDCETAPSSHTRFQV